MPQILPTCMDSDGNNSYIYGNCTDWRSNYSNFSDDACTMSGTNNQQVQEMHCGNFSIPDSNCDHCTNVTCRNIGTPAEGWYADCSNGNLRYSKEIVNGKCSVLGGHFNPVDYRPYCVSTVINSYWQAPLLIVRVMRLLAIHLVLMEHVRLLVLIIALTGQARLTLFSLIN